MGKIKRKMTLEETQKFFEASMTALNEGSPVKTPIFKTLDSVQVILAEEAKSLREVLDTKVEKWEDNKPVFKEGVTNEEYLEVINSSRTKELEIEIETVKPDSNYILPNGTRIRLEDYLEKATAVSPRVFSTLKEYYIS